MLSLDYYFPLSHGSGGSGGGEDINFDNLPICWRGTPIPINSNPNDKLYVNYNLSEVEIAAVTSKLNYISAELLFDRYGDYQEFYIVSYNAASDTLLLIKRIKVWKRLEIFTLNTEGKYIYQYGNELPYWNDYKGPDDLVNMTGQSEFKGFPVGAQNDLISSLLSTTPFEYVEQSVKEGSLCYYDKEYVARYYKKPVKLFGGMSYASLADPQYDSEDKMGVHVHFDPNLSKEEVIKIVNESNVKSVATTNPIGTPYYPVNSDEKIINLYHTSPTSTAYYRYDLEFNGDSFYIVYSLIGYSSSYYLEEQKILFDSEIGWCDDIYDYDAITFVNSVYHGADTSLYDMDVWTSLQRIICAGGNVKSYVHYVSFMTTVPTGLELVFA